jgi:hypothetical protein
MARRRPIGCLEEHPNAAEILGLIARLPHIADADLPRLAEKWTNTIVVADARSRALQPDSPLIFEVLASFDAVQALWADDLAGDTDVDPATVTTALKAVRDAIAGAYARPVLSRRSYAYLLRPWRSVYPVDDRDEPDLGRRGGDVKQLLGALPWLATRCHDVDAAARWDALTVQAWCSDAGERAAAREEAWAAAVVTGRRRTWDLLRRSGTQSLSRPCRSCRTGWPDDSDVTQVLSLCLDAACGLLVADALPERLLAVLTAPLELLIPKPRQAF